MSVEQLTVWVRTSFVGFHYWPGAPPSRGYLGQPHRHTFGVRVEVEVTHDDRELEFHDLLDIVTDFVTQMAPVEQVTNIHRCGSMSCEQMAMYLALALREALDRGVTVGVDEDGECGAYVELSYP